VHARLEHRATFALGAERRLDGAQDLVVRQGQPLDVGPVQVGEVERLHGRSTRQAATGVGSKRYPMP
jgi:hypothetical protein